MRRNPLTCWRPYAQRHPDGIDAILDLVNGPNRIQDDFNILKKGQWFSERGVATLNFIANQSALVNRWPDKAR
jgi:hypothetical protein